jgi:hypothetical protein
VNRRVLFIAIGAGVCVAAIVLLILVWPAPEEPVAEVAERRAPAAPSRPRATPEPSAPRAPERESRPEEPAEPTPAEPEAPAPVPEPAPAPEAPPVPAMGLLRIEADVPGAQVFLDRRFVGVAPVTAEDVTPGTHQLNVSAEGYEGIVMPVEVTAGRREIAVRFREVRLNASIDVVHRHGVGSCRGRLTATPAGIKYETSNRDDAFSAGLLDLETFQVDYLAKNLRLRLAKGRQFNFTDPDGNADRLFVFHRDVDRARERLRKGEAPGGN